MPRHHHELLTTEAGAMVLAFSVLLRPVASAIGHTVKKALSAITPRKEPKA